MTATTAVTLATGRTLNVRGTYEDVKAMMAAPTLSAILGDGRRITLATGAIVAFEEGAENNERREIGFR